MEAVTKRINKLLDGEGLPPSTRKFLLSLRSWNEKRPLTIKQMSALTIVEERNLLPQNNVDESWRTKYDNDSKMKEQMIICAKYYDANPPYYSDLVFRVLNESDFVPTEKQYFALTTNNYSNKVLKAHYKNPDYEEDSYVCLRKGADSELRDEIGDRPCLVLKANAGPVTHARIGAKKYKIIPFGVSKVFTVEERQLKKANIKKS
tara:strand:+ start:400 stop:1014 length:615 start_codon:yes stop_codon:yes gene_type:complete